eukprot:g78455.t1
MEEFNSLHKQLLTRCGFFHRDRKSSLTRAISCIPQPLQDFIDEYEVRFSQLTYKELVPKASLAVMSLRALNCGVFTVSSMLSVLQQGASSRLNDTLT